MASDWTDALLSEVIDVRHGFAFPGAHIQSEPVGDILVTPGNFAIGGGFKADKLKYFDGEVPDEYVLEDGDLIVTMTDLSKQSDSLGYPAFVPRLSGRRFLHNQRIGKVEIRRNAALDRGFLFYLLRTPEYRHEVLASATGTAIKHTSPGRILAYKARLPPLAEQKAIARVLSALDDKVELNRRMNGTLEAMARALFRSWFVDFDPVRAKLDGRQPVGLDPDTAGLFPDSFEDSPLGHIPRGWRTRPLPELIEVNPARALTRGTDAPYLGMKNLPTEGHTVGEVVTRPFTSGSRYANGDALMARITPCLENGKTGYVDFLDDGEVGWGSTEFIVLAARPPLPPEFVYLLARSDTLRSHAIQNMTGTSGRQRVPTQCLDAFLIAEPMPKITARFRQLVVPLMQKIRANSTQSRTLASLRDTLLPKLLSGELRVNQAEVAVEEVA